jgi:phage antirepressor YoqD-like protein
MDDLIKSIKGLTKTEYKNIQVLTTNQLADSYGTDTKNISYNYNGNKERFKENVDFFFVSYADSCYREFQDNENVKRSIYLWTEKGCLKHAKMLNNDKAWQVYDLLVDLYFRSKKELTKLEILEMALSSEKALIAEKEKTKQLENTIIEQKPLVDFANDIRICNNSIDIGTFSKILNVKGMGVYNLFEYLRDEEYLIPKGEKKNLPYEKYTVNNGLGYFEVIEKIRTIIIDNKKEKIVYPQTLITGKGQLYFQKLLKKNNEKELTLFDEEELKNG